MITEEQYLEAQKIVDAYEEQLRIANVSKSLLTCKCGNKVQDLYAGLCLPCWRTQRHEESKQRFANTRVCFSLSDSIE